jgi:hypothetical protein
VCALFGSRNVAGRVLVDNVGSISVLEKCRFTRVDAMSFALPGDLCS